MTDKPGHPIDALHDALSGRLTGPERAALDAHLAACDACRREFDALSAVRGTLGARLDEAVHVPEDLEARLRQALDAEDRAYTPQAVPPRVFGRRRWLGAGLAAAAALLLAVVFLQRGAGAPTAPEDVAQALGLYADGALPVDTRTGDPAALERRLATADLGFSTRVFDFGGMAYHLTGGGVHTIQGRPSALFVYDGPNGLKLLCQMYLGSVADLPPPAERRTNAGIEFLVYRIDEVTVVFWAEDDGRVLCALAADGDPETAVQFAFAKAIGPGVS